MILYFEKFWPSDPKVVAEGAAGVQAPLEEEQLRIILTGHVKKICFDLGGVLVVTIHLHSYRPNRTLIFIVHQWDSSVHDTIVKAAGVLDKQRDVAFQRFS